MDPQMFCIYLPVFVAVCLALLVLARYILNSFSDSETETELERDKEESDRIGAEAGRISEGIAEDEKLSQGIGESQQRASDSAGKAEKAIARAREKGRKTIELADECLAILEEAEKKDEYSD